jgi:single-strand DNA-binding protein
MASVNRVFLVGHMGKDPEMRFTPGGDPVVNFTMATSQQWKNREGQAQERTEWHRVEFWGKTAQYVSDVGQKGALVYVEGEIRTEEWTDKEEKKRTTVKIRAQRVLILANGRPRAEKPEGERESGPAEDLW